MKAAFLSQLLGFPSFVWSQSTAAPPVPPPFEPPTRSAVWFPPALGENLGLLDSAVQRTGWSQPLLSESSPFRLASAIRLSEAEPISVDDPVVIADPSTRPSLLPDAAPITPEHPPYLSTPTLPPLGFSGPSSIIPTEGQNTSHFVPVEDRWRIGFPEWDRYGKGHPVGDDYPSVQGKWYDPYNQNVLKGDYPISGNDTFLKLNFKQLNLLELRQTPIPTTPFEATLFPFENEFFGDPNQFFFTQYNSAAVDLFKGDAGFKPMDWRFRANFIFNHNYLRVNELAVVSPDVTDGRNRHRAHFAIEEWFYETKIADMSPNYDFLSIRAGSQPFTSDFRGLSSPISTAACGCSAIG